jgi:glyoxylase I family protein
MFKRIDHIEIVTSELNRTIEFYTAVLGFKVKSRERVDRSAVGVPMDIVYLELGGTVVELISYDGASVAPAPHEEHLGYRMMALEVADMQATADYLKTKGVEIVWGPKTSEKAARAEIRDCNGYHIELRQWF